MLGEARRDARLLPSSAARPTSNLSLDGHRDQHGYARLPSLVSIAEHQATRSMTAVKAAHDLKIEIQGLYIERTVTLPSLVPVTRQGGVIKRLCSGGF